MTTTDSFYPNSRRIYVPGKIHPDLRVSLREISQSPTRLPDGRTEENSNVSVYDTSGPWGDPVSCGDVGEGLPPLRRAWILGRADVEEYEGRRTLPVDDGYLSRVHVESAMRNGRRGQLELFPGLKRANPPRLRRTSRNSALVCATRHNHAGNGIYRDPGKPGKRAVDERRRA